MIRELGWFLLFILGSVGLFWWTGVFDPEPDNSQAKIIHFGEEHRELTLTCATVDGQKFKVWAPRDQFPERRVGSTCPNGQRFHVSRSPEHWHRP